MRALQRRGHQVEIVTALPHHLTGRIFSQYRGKFYVEESFEGNRIHRTWAYPASGVGLGRFFNYISFTLTSLFGLFRCQRPQYLFVESPPLFLGIAGVLFCSVRRVPMIFNVADLWPDSVRQLGVVKNELLLSLANRLESWIYGKSRFVNATTVGIRETLLTTKKLPRSRVLFLPNGVDTSLFAPCEKDAALLRELNIGNARIFVYAGTHGVAQGLETLLDAAVLLRDSNITILFIGDGPTKKRLVNKATEQHVKNVVFLGMQPVEAIPRFFSLATASIVPLVRNDLFKGARPSKIFSALAAGLPVIFCGEGESAALLTAHHAGIVVEPQNARALADAIIRLSADPQFCKELGMNGRKLANEEFDWDSIVERWLGQIQSAQTVDAGGLKKP